MPSVFQRLGSVAKTLIPRPLREAWDGHSTGTVGKFRYPDTGIGITDQDLTDRATLQDEVFRIFKTNPIAQNIIETTTMYVIGDRQEIDHPNDEIDAFITRWAEYTNLKVNLRPWVNEQSLGGELFLEHQDNGAGMTKFVAQDVRTIDSIKVSDNDLSMPESYHQKYTKSSRSSNVITTTEPVDRDIKAENMLHVKINNLSHEKFGRSDLARALPYLQMYDGWLKNRMRVNYNKTLFMNDVSCETKEGTEAAIARFTNQELEPGIFNIHTSSEVWQMLQPSVGADDAMEDGRAIKLMICNAARLPEYMLADGQNSNLASSQSQELPVIKKFKDRQNVIEQMLKDMIKIALMNAVKAKLLPATWKNEKGEVIETTDVSYVDITLGLLDEEDAKGKGELALKLWDRGVLSKKTMLADLGYNPEVEEKLIADEQQEGDAATTFTQPHESQA